MYSVYHTAYVLFLGYRGLGGMFPFSPCDLMMIIWCESLVWQTDGWTDRRTVDDSNSVRLTVGAQKWKIKRSKNEKKIHVMTHLHAHTHITYCLSKLNSSRNFDKAERKLLPEYRAAQYLSAQCIGQFIKSDCLYVGQWVCLSHETSWTLSTDRNAPPILTKIATKVQSREVRKPAVFGENPKDACPPNRKWN